MYKKPKEVEVLIKQDGGGMVSKGGNMTQESHDPEEQRRLEKGTGPGVDNLDSPATPQNQRMWSCHECRQILIAGCM